MTSVRIPQPYLVFVGDQSDSAFAKTAHGLRDWRPDLCVGQYRLSEKSADLGLPDLDFASAAARGAQSLVIGVAPQGGRIRPEWVPHLAGALRSGLDLVAGLHDRLSANRELVSIAEHAGRSLYDIRYVDRDPPLATGRIRSGHRVLTVGTDCQLGKKYTALALARELQTRGLDATFRATGQTGILIAGEGVPADAVKSDFIAGAIENLTPAGPSSHWDIIEGQGSLFHPAYAAVTLGLLHGAQAQSLILCHDPTRTHIVGFPDYSIPALEDCMDLYLRCARLTSPDVRFVGISLNTKMLSDREASTVIHEVAERYGLPCSDPIRYGVQSLVDGLTAGAR